jgi:non-ribosomal peptide synthetase component F
MWVLHRADPTGAAYNVCLHLTFAGALDLPALRVALRALVERHEVLRTRYPSGADDLPYQRVDPEPGEEDFPLPLVDLRDRPEGTADRLIAELAGYRFDLARDWPFRFALFRTGEQEYRLGLLVHHIAWDGGTWPVLAADLSAAYAAALVGSAMAEPPALQYGDFAAAWEQRPPDLDQRDYWRKQLTDLPGPLALPADRPEPAGETSSGGRRSLVLTDAEGAALRQFAREAGVTPFTVLLAAFGALLHRSTGRTDLPIGTAVMSREGAAAQGLVGNFGNTLVLRLDAADDPEFTELLRRADHVASAGFAHQDLPYDQVVADLRERGEQHAGDAFNVMLLVLAQGLTGPELPGVRTSWRNVHNGTHQFDLSLEAFLIDGGTEIEATYSAELFSAARIDALLHDLRNLLAAAAAHPHIRLSALPTPHLATEALPAEPIRQTSSVGDSAGHEDADAVRRIRAIMADLLETDEIGENADFFASGGNSLLSTRLVARVRDELGTDVSVRTVAELRTPARIAAAAVASGNTASWRTVRAREHSDMTDITSIADIEDLEARPLSVAQHALWFLYQANGPAPDYNVAFTRRLTGPLDVGALRAALVDLVDRHEALRTVIYTVVDEAEQFIMDTATALLAGAELCVRATDDLDRDLTAALGYAFDLTAEPAFRPVLFRLSETESVLLLLTHHLFADEWSETVLWKDLARAYRARSAGTAPEFTALPVTYTDYARWQQAALSGPELTAQRAFWRTTLADLPEQIDLPTDRPYAPGLPTDGDAVTIDLPRPVMAGLRALAHRAETTPFVVWHALVALLLHRNGAGVDLPLGTPVTGRGTVELDGVVGMFVNSVVLRADLSGNPTFSELLRRLAAADLAAFARQDLPFERVVDLIEPPRVLGRNPLFQTMVVYADAAPTGPRLPGVADEPLAARLQTAKFDLSITLTDDAAAPPTATLRYRTALFDRSTAERLANELGQLAATVAAEPDLPLARIDHLPSTERVRLLETWNATAAPVSETTLPELFAAQVAATPDAVALVCGDEALTYRELDERAGRLAAELVADGVGAEQVVGIHLDRSTELVVALLAVQRAGGAFVPLEPSWPRRRIEETLRTSRPVLVISEDASASDWSGVPVRTVATTRDLPLPAPAASTRRTSPT